MTTEENFKTECLKVFDACVDNFLSSIPENHLTSMSYAETQAYVFFLFVYIFKANPNYTTLNTKLIQHLSDSSMAYHDSRLKLYSDILSEKIQPRYEYMLSVESEKLKLNGVYKTFCAFTDIIYNPKCADDYINAPFLIPDIFEASSFFDVCTGALTEILIKNVKSICELHNKYSSQINAIPKKISDNLYDTLEVAESASPEVIHASYKTLAKKYHPDICKINPEKAAECMKVINYAFAVLSDPEKRRQYDVYLKELREKTQKSYNPQPESKPKEDDNPSKHKNETQTQEANKKFSTKKSKQVFKDFAIVLGTFFLLLISVVILFYITDSGDSDTKSVDTTARTWVISEPPNGAILQGLEVYDESEITVSASSDSACVVKLKASDGTTRLSFYVQAGHSATIGVPCEKLYVYFASGKEWQGRSDLFGKDTYYSKDKDICDFSEYTWEYSLQSTYDGNFSTVPIDKDEFE